MSPSKKPVCEARRRFVVGAGLATAALSPAAALARAVLPSPIRVGVLLATSQRYPRLSERLLAGFAAYTASPCDDHGVGLRIVPIACTPGAGTYAAARGAIERGEVDVLAGFGDRALTARLAPLLEAHRIPFVVTDLGADIVRQRRESGWVVRNTLGLWQANYTMGQWSAAHLGQRALIACDFLESGYDMVYAFRRAFEDAGGEVPAVVVTGLPDGRGTLPEVARAVDAHRPDFVYAFYSGHRAEAFLRFYERERLARAAPLAGAALLTDSVTGSHPLPASAGVITVSPWWRGDASAANLALHRACRAGQDVDGDLFAALGYEAAQRIAAGFAAPVRGHAVHAMASASYAGTRGEVRPDPDLAETRAGAYVLRVEGSADALAHVALERLAPPRIAPALRHELRTMIKSGWANAYLAV